MHCTVMFCAALSCAVMYCTVLWCAPYWSVLLLTTLYCVVRSSIELRYHLRTNPCCFSLSPLIAIIISHLSPLSPVPSFSPCLTQLSFLFLHSTKLEDNNDLKVDAQSFFSHLSSLSSRLIRLSLLSHTHHFHLSQSCNQLSSRRWQIRLNRSGESSSALSQTWRGTQRAAIGVDTYMPCTDWTDPIFLNFVFLSLNVGFCYIYYDDIKKYALYYYNQRFMILYRIAKRWDSSTQLQ